MRTACSFSLKGSHDSPVQFSLAVFSRDLEGPSESHSHTHHRVIHLSQLRV